MPTSKAPRIAALARVAGIALALAALPSAAAAQMKFKQKECLDCHTKLADKYAAYKVTHKAVRERKCEECHLRHGLVPKLLLKESGNRFCYKCHDKKSIGMDKPNVHSVLRQGKCTTCHDAHGSNAPHMLISTPEEDVIFVAIKDLSHGIIGKAVDGTMDGPAYLEGYAPK